MALKHVIFWPIPSVDNFQSAVDRILEQLGNANAFLKTRSPKFFMPSYEKCPLRIAVSSKQHERVTWHQLDDVIEVAKNTELEISLMREWRHSESVGRKCSSDYSSRS
jgi:hypothetical protein